MPPGSRVPKPIGYGALARRRVLPAKGDPQRASVPLLDVSLEGVTDQRIVTEQGRLRVSVEVGVDGLDRRRRHERIPVTRLTAEDVGSPPAADDLKGYRPAGVKTAFAPAKAKPTHRGRARRGKDPDLPGTIFGTDDRYLFDDLSFPWRTTGKVRTAGAWGSGTTIGPRHVLTASHVVDWTGGARGEVGWLTFSPGYFDGPGPWGEIAATRVIYWEDVPGGVPIPDEQTAFDYVVLVMEDRIGDIVGYPGFRTYDDAWNGEGYWQYIGYPGELSSGERPAFQGEGVVSTVQDETLSGQTGYVLGHFNEFTPGQSGGAIWGWWGREPWPRVVGVGSTIGSTAVQEPTGSTTGDNEYGGGPGLSSLIAWARANHP